MIEKKIPISFKRILKFKNSKFKELIIIFWSIRLNIINEIKIINFFNADKFTLSSITPTIKIRDDIKKKLKYCLSPFRKLIWYLSKKPSKIIKYSKNKIRFIKYKNPPIAATFFYVFF